MEAGNWIPIALSVMRTDIRTNIQVYCNLVYQDVVSVAATFASSDTFYIGSNFYGVIREFKLYTMALGGESLTMSTSSKPSLT